MQHNIKAGHTQSPLPPQRAPRSPRRKETHPNRCGPAHPLARSQRPAIQHLTICEGAGLRRCHELRRLGFLVASSWTQRAPQRYLRPTTVSIRVRRERGSSLDERRPPEEPVGTRRGFVRTLISGERVSRLDGTGRNHRLPALRARAAKRGFVRRCTRRRCLWRQDRSGRSLQFLGLGRGQILGRERPTPAGRSLPIRRMQSNGTFWA